MGGAGRSVLQGLYALSMLELVQHLRSHGRVAAFKLRRGALLLLLALLLSLDASHSARLAADGGLDQQQEA